MSNKIEFLIVVLAFLVAGLILLATLHSIKVTETQQIIDNCLPRDEGEKAVIVISHQNFVCNIIPLSRS